MTSPLTGAELVERLSARLEPIPRSPFWYPRSGMAYLGRVVGDSFRMYPRGLGRNSWRWVYTGSVDSDAGTARLTGALGPPRLLLIFSALWVGLVVAFVVVGAWGLIHRLSDGGAVIGPLIATLAPFVMLAFFVAVSNTGWKSAGREWASMEKWLKATVQATPSRSRKPADDQ
jgi:hypothetical protein